jgi:hypothetical protein
MQQDLASKEKRKWPKAGKEMPGSGDVAVITHQSADPEFQALMFFSLE